MLADVRLAHEETLATRHRHRHDVTPERQARHQIRRILGEGLIEQPAKDGAENDGHGDRLEQRPTDAERRTAIAGAQIHLDQRQPEIATAPYGAEIGNHAVQTSASIPWAVVLPLSLRRSAP